MTKRSLSILFSLIVLSLSVFIDPIKATAHPADITNIDIFVEKDAAGQEIAPDTAQANIYFGWAQANFLVQKAQNISDIPAVDLVKYPKVFTNYISEKVQFFNNEKLCGPIYKDVPEKTEDEILFGTGLQVNMEFKCTESLNELRITNHLFTDEFERQSNYITVFKGGDYALKGGLMTPLNAEFTVGVNDSGSGQTANAPKNSWLIERLSQNLVEKGKNSIWFALGLVFLLGLLHTLEAGHSKSILTSSLLDHRLTLKHGFIYAAIFTVTHIADILVLGVGLLIANSFVDVYSKLSFLQTFSLYALLFISVYLFFQHLAELIKSRLTTVTNDHNHHDVNHHHEHSHAGHTHSHELPSGNIKRQLMIGFLTGLSPCLFGWSIFMVILSTRSIWTVFPIIIAFGLGIFLALSIIAIIVTRFKKPIMERVSWIGEVSPMISSLLLVIFALSLLI